MSYEYSHHYPGALRAGVDIDALTHLYLVDADERLAPLRARAAPTRDSLSRS